jgi:hypothetical protein
MEQTCWPSLSWNSDQAAQGDLTPTSDNLEELLETYKVNVTEFSLVNEKPK